MAHPKTPAPVDLGAYHTVSVGDCEKVFDAGDCPGNEGDKAFRTCSNTRNYNNTVVSRIAAHGNGTNSCTNGVLRLIPDSMFAAPFGTCVEEQDDKGNVTTTNCVTEDVTAALKHAGITTAPVGHESDLVTQCATINVSKEDCLKRHNGLQKSLNSMMTNNYGENIVNNVRGAHMDSMCNPPYNFCASQAEGGAGLDFSFDGVSCEDCPK
jgi:hypothetical protein